MKTLALILAVLILAGPVSAVELRWEPRWQSIAPGADGSVAVMLDDAIDCRTIEVTISYDPDVVTGVTTTPGSIYDGVGCFLWEDCEEDVPGLFHAFVVLMGGVCFATGPGELLVWHFTAGAEIGATDLGVVDVYLSDPNADPIPDLTLGGATIAVSDPVSWTVPARPEPTLRLAPNPFNPLTRLTLDSPSPRDARLVAYDAAGRSVGTVWKGRLGPTPLAVDWHGRDAAGRPLPSGSYLFRLVTPGETPIVVRGLLLR